MAYYILDEKSPSKRAMVDGIEIDLQNTEEDPAEFTEAQAKRLEDAGVTLKKVSAPPRRQKTEDDKKEDS